MEMCLIFLLSTTDDDALLELTKQTLFSKVARHGITGCLNELQYSQFTVGSSFRSLVMLTTSFSMSFVIVVAIRTEGP